MLGRPTGRQVSQAKPRADEFPCSGSIKATDGAHEQGDDGVRLTIDTETDSLATVIATLTAAYGEEVSLGGGSNSGSRPATTRRAAGPKPKATPSAAEVRVWAKRRGIAVAQQGRIPAQVMEQYLAARK